MIKLQDILFAFSKEIKKNFKEKIYVEEDNITNNKGDYFFLHIYNTSSEIVGTRVDAKQVIVMIEYYQQRKDSKFDLYEVNDKLRDIFVRGIQVENRFLKFKTIQPNIVKDSINNYISFVVTIEYFERVNFAEPQNDKKMEKLNIKLGEGE